ncbi:MAG TPA: hypothetical protein H9903_08890 [Candidatus Aquabacterium excrementipullorum]|nr:hypothetical protein [Candidatus Aquabacterium excrementipullorum]
MKPFPKLAARLAVITTIIGMGGCAYVVQPQSFVPKGVPADKVATVLNQYTKDNFQYLIKSVDGQKLGDAMRGTNRITEVYLAEGKHRLDIVASLSSGTYIEMALASAFVGEIDCDVKANRFYTLATSQMDMPSINPQPHVKRQLEIHCVEHQTKPDNPVMRAFVQKHGWTLSPEPYRPD